MWQDIRHGLRIFMKMPVFTGIAVLSIAFGTGANVAIFSAVDALLLRPPAVPKPNDLITVGARVDRGLGTLLRMSYPDYADVRRRARSFSGLVAVTNRWVGFAAHPQTPARIKVAALVTANYFQVLGIRPQLGREFLPEEDREPGRHAVAILSDEAWQREFSRDPAVIGRTVRISAIDFTIVGVAPEWFTGLDPFTRHDVYVPLAMWSRVNSTLTTDPLEDRGLRVLTVTGRLKPTVSLNSARVELAAIGSDLERAYPATNTKQPLMAQSELQMRFERRPVDSRTLVLLTTLSIAVLCVACANVAGLLASRAPIRMREIALRLSIGASRGRIVAQLVAESVAIAVAGGVGGIALGYGGILMFRQIEWSTEVINYPAIQLDERTLSFALVAAIASVFAFGLGPAIQTARVDLAKALKATEAIPSKRRRHGRHGLVATQVAVSMGVLTIAAFTFQIFQRELRQGPGFRVDHVAMARLDPSQAHYSMDATPRLFERVLEEVRRLPTVVSATVASEVPLWGLELSSMVPEGHQLAQGQAAVRLYANSVDESFFETMGIPILAGRAFRHADTAGSPRVAIVNEAIARHYWPGQDAVGRRFRLYGANGPWVEVVGVAKMSTYAYPGEPAFEVAYFPFRQQPRGNMAVLVHTSGDSAALLGELTEIVRRIDDDVPVHNVQTMEHFYAARATNLSGLAVTFIGALGFMGLSLAVVGLYGLVSYDVGRRTREIGLRMAIGASAGRVLLLILSQGMRPAWAGLAIGLGLSAVIARALPALVPIGARVDTTTVLAVVPIVVVVTLLGAWIPARRASRVDPTIALRAE